MKTIRFILAVIGQILILPYLGIVFLFTWELPEKETSSPGVLASAVNIAFGLVYLLVLLALLPVSLVVVALVVAVAYLREDHTTLELFVPWVKWS